MKLGLNGSTTDQCTLEEDVIVAEQAGFDIVEPRTYKINTFLQNKTIEELGELFKNSNVTPYAINAIEFFNLKQSLEEKQKMLEETDYWCKIANKIGCPYVIAVPSEITGEANESDIFDDTVEMLLKMSDVAAKYNVKLALEFIGFESFSIRTLSLANEIVEAVNRSNIGLVIDTYHFYLGNSNVESIEEVNKDNIFIFHINDAENLPKKDLIEANRIFPGLGAIPLNSIGEALHNIGYKEMTSLELFRPEYWEMEKQHLADEAFKHVKKSTDSMFR